METSRFHYLLQKYFSGEITEKEQHELDEGLKDATHVREFRSYARLNRRISELSHEPASGEKKEKVLQEIMKRPAGERKVFRLPVLFRYAAAVVVLFGLGIVLLNRSAETGNRLVVEDTFVKLRLSDNLVKSLQSEGHSTISSDDNVRVEQSGDTVRYTITGKSSSPDYNEIEVPYGKTAVLVLSDGSHLTLNAGSSLKFPRDVAAADTREVYLNGEAHFDVARDTSRPFIVHADEVNIQVLGTRFTVTNYDSGNTVNTVLVEGKVALYGGTDTYKEDKSLVIYPGTLARFDKSGEYMESRNVDTSLYTSWMQGELTFEGADFATIVHSLERRFNVEIENRNSGLEREKFTAKFRDEPIEKILESFRQSYPFEYTIKKNKIMIN